MFRKTLRTATLAVAAVAAMSLMAAESSAQCGGYGGGFNNGFNSFGYNTFSRPVYSGYRGGFYSAPAYYGRSYGGGFGRAGCGW